MTGKILSEGQFQQMVLNYLKEHHVWYVKYWSGGRYTKEGIPDILALINGRLHGIELKNDGKAYNETTLQAMNLDHINHGGGEGYVLRPSKYFAPKQAGFNYYCTTFSEWKEKWFDDNPYKK